MAVQELQVLAVVPSVVVVPVVRALLLPLLQVVGARQQHLLPVLLAVLLVPAQLPVVALPLVLVDLAEEALQLPRSFSAAMAGLSPSRAPPM